MTSCDAAYMWYRIEPPMEMLIENLWIFIAVAIVLLFIVIRIKSVREKLKSKSHLLFSVLDKISLLLFGLLVAYFGLLAIVFIIMGGVTCAGPGILTDEVLYRQIENKVVDSPILQGVTLMPDGYFESSKYTFSCISNSKIASAPSDSSYLSAVPPASALYFADSEPSIPHIMKDSFPPELKCKDFVKGNKIVNNTEDQHFLVLYQCEPSNKINAIAVRGSGITSIKIFALKKPEFFCDYLLN